MVHTGRVFLITDGIFCRGGNIPVGMYTCWQTSSPLLKEVTKQNLSFMTIFSISAKRFSQIVRLCQGC